MKITPGSDARAFLEAVASVDPSSVVNRCRRIIEEMPDDSKIDWGYIWAKALSEQDRQYPRDATRLNGPFQSPSSA